MPMQGGVNQLERFMAAIRRLESGSYAGNYNAIGPQTRWGTAKGAYQVLDGTWANYGGYATANAAPKEVQDQWARDTFTANYNQYGSWEEVTSIHFTGRTLAEAGVTSDGFMSNTEYGAQITEYYNAPEAGEYNPGSSEYAVTDATVEVPELEGELPPDGRLYETDDGRFVIRYKVARRVFMEWEVTDPRLMEGYGRVRDYENSTWGQRDNQYLVRYEESGNAYELLTLPAGMSPAEHFEETVLKYMSPYHPGRDDPEVMAVMARIAANPDAGEDTIRGWLNKTQFWAHQTEIANSWNDMSPAQREAEIDDMAFRLQQDYWSIVGHRIPLDHGQLQAWAESIANGTVTYGTVINDIQTHAEGDAESPYSRATRDEVRSQRQWSVDTENLAEQLQNQAESYGVRLSDEQVNRWAEAIMMNESSTADFENSLEEQARILYPGLPEGMHPGDYASPWISTLNRVMETSAGMFDPRVQQALQGGMNAFEFERMLMQDPAWQDTGNAYEAFEGAMAAVSRQMGFN